MFRSVRFFRLFVCGVALVALTSVPVAYANVEQSAVVKAGRLAVPTALTLGLTGSGGTAEAAPGEAVTFAGTSMLQDRSRLRIEIQKQESGWLTLVNGLSSEDTFDPSTGRWSATRTLEGFDGERGARQARVSELNEHHRPIRSTETTFTLLRPLTVTVNSGPLANSFLELSGTADGGQISVDIEVKGHPRPFLKAVQYFPATGFWQGKAVLSHDFIQAGGKQKLIVREKVGQRERSSSISDQGAPSVIQVPSVTPTIVKLTGEHSYTFPVHDGEVWIKPHEPFTVEGTIGSMKYGGRLEVLAVSLAVNKFLCYAYKVTGAWSCAPRELRLPEGVYTFKAIAIDSANKGIGTLRVRVSSSEPPTT